MVRCRKSGPWLSMYDSARARTLGAARSPAGVTAEVYVAELLLGELACVGEGQVSRVAELEPPDARRVLGAIAERVGALVAEADAQREAGDGARRIVPVVPLPRGGVWRALMFRPVRRALSSNPAVVA